MGALLFALLPACSSVPPVASDAAEVAAPAAESLIPIAFRRCYEKATEGAEAMQLEQQTVFVAPGDLLDNRHVAHAWVAEETEGDCAVMIEFTEAGRSLFSQVTTELVDQRIAILVAGQIVVAPMVRMPITGGRAMLAGNYSNEEARRIAEGITPRAAPPDEP